MARATSGGVGLEFLSGGGYMGERIRAHAWADTSLGDPRGWPQSLRTTMRVLLTTGHPTMIMWGPELRCFYNDPFSRSLGPEKHPGILGAPGREAWAEVWPIVGDQIEQVQRGEGAVWHENQCVPIIRHGALQEVYWTYSYSPIDDPASPNGVGGVLVTCAETTEQVLGGRTMSLNLARLDYATRLSGVGFWYCDLPFDTLEWDDRVKEHFFFAPTDRITIDDFYARIHADDREHTREAIDASIRQRTPYDIVYRTVHPSSGEIKWIRALGGTDYAPDGTPTHFDGVTVDVSEQKADQQRLAMLNHQLREQDRRKDEFIATLSHELRNPLAPIQAAARLIASPTLAPAQLQQAQQIIDRQVMHMALLLDDLLDVARITQGKLQLKKEALALARVVDAAVEAVRPTLDRKHQHLEVHLPRELPSLVADHLRLSQILSNLLTNASKYSNTGSRIALTCSVEDHMLALTVTDNGIGIAPESLGGIFEMFSQIQGEAGRSDGGLGIGLALVKGLAELHGGTVEARSGGLGRGSEFIVRLPRGPRAEGLAPSSHRPRA